jgi:diamine N-acetyltransferase
VEPQKFSPTVLLKPPAPDLARESSGLPPSGILYERGLILVADAVARERREGIHAEETGLLRGESVTLRPPREDDVEAAYAWDRDPELAAWNGRPPIRISLPAARRDYLSRWEDPSVKTFIIEARDEPNGEPDRPIGMATLYDFRRGGCELGIKIGDKYLRGRGYASEAVELLLSYCFDTLGLQTVRGSTLSHNVRMQRVFEKSGFRRSGTVRSSAASTTNGTPNSYTRSGGTASWTALILFRPVGMHGLSLTYESGMRAFPPRPPEQPTFCPL